MNRCIDDKRVKCIPNKFPTCRGCNEREKRLGETKIIKTSFGDFKKPHRCIDDSRYLCNPNDYDWCYRCGIGVQFLVKESDKE